MRGAASILANLLTSDSKVLTREEFEEMGHEVDALSQTANETLQRRVLELLDRHDFSGSVKVVIDIEWHVNHDGPSLTKEKP